MRIFSLGESENTRSQQVGRGIFDPVKWAHMFLIGIHSWENMDGPDIIINWNLQKSRFQEFSIDDLVQWCPTIYLINW